MVAGLSARLTDNGADVDGWMKLMRSYVVLGEPAKAVEALDRAPRRAGGRQRGPRAGRGARPRPEDRGLTVAMTRKQRRLTLIGASLGVLGVAAALVLISLRDTIVFLPPAVGGGVEGHPARHALPARRSRPGRQRAARARSDA
jgi:hypothetical protein